MLKFFRNVAKRICGLRPNAKPDYNLLVLGLNNSGKSSLVARLSRATEENIRQINPTTNLTETDLAFKNIKIHLRDLSGECRMRQSWHTFYEDTSALIFVIDSSDVVRLSEARCELCDVLLDERMSQVPLLVVANKQDVSGAMSSSMIIDLIGLNRLEGRIWKIQECSSLTGSGSFDVMDWIYKSYKHQQPPSRIQKLFNPAFIFGQFCPFSSRPLVDV